MLQLLPEGDVMERMMYCTKCKRVALHRISRTIAVFYNGQTVIHFTHECRYVRVKVKKTQILCGREDYAVIPLKEYNALVDDNYW